MSLDVYLSTPTAKKQCPHCWAVVDGSESLLDYREEHYSSNITHNLGRMATEAGIYEALWCPEEIGITHAKQLVEPLAAGLALLKSDEARFSAFNASNGWGLYEHFVPFVENYLEACREHPEAEVQVSR